MVNKVTFFGAVHVARDRRLLPAVDSVDLTVSAVVIILDAVDAALVEAHVAKVGDAGKGVPGKVLHSHDPVAGGARALAGNAARVAGVHQHVV